MIHSPRPEDDTGSATTGIGDMPLNLNPEDTRNALSSLINEDVPTAPATEEEARQRLAQAAERNAAEMTDTAEAAFEARRKVAEGVADVYIPTVPNQPAAGHPRRVQFELRALTDGTAALPIFTTVGLLAEQLGQFQPWEKVPVLELLIQVSTSNVPVVVNPVVRKDVKLWTAADLQAWGEQQQ